MPWNNTTKILTKPISIADVSAALGSDSLDLGTLCISNLNNPMAKFKPIYNTAIGQVTDAQRSASAASIFGLSIPEFGDASVLITSSNSWKYTKPTGSRWKRIFDYISESSPTVLGYYAEAPRNVFTCLHATTDTVEINPINEYAPNEDIFFYAFSKNPTNNGIYDKQPSASQGISGTSYGHSANQLSCSLGIEDLQANVSGSAGSLLYGTYHRLGLALFTSTTQASYSQFVPCTADLKNDKATLDRDMVSIPLSTLLQIPVGNYTAIGCMRVGNPIVPIGEEPSFTFIPTHAYNWDGSANKRNSFSLNIGGMSNYSTSIMGVSDLAGGIPSGMCYDTDGQVYVFMDVTNTTSLLHHTSASTFNRWSGSFTIVGSYVNSEGTTVYVNKTLSESIYKVGNSIVTSTKTFDIAAGGTVRFCFSVGPIWGTTAEVLRSGEVDITAQLKFDNGDFPISQTTLMKVRYGTQL